MYSTAVFWNQISQINGVCSASEKVKLKELIYSKTRTFSWNSGPESNVPFKRMVGLHVVLAALCKHYGDEQNLMLDWA